MCGVLFACSDTIKVSQVLETTPEIFPDYTDVVIPFNIAPLNFMVEGADNIAVTIDGNSTYKFQTRGDILSFPIKKWKKMEIKSI